MSVTIKNQKKPAQLKQINSYLQPYDHSYNSNIEFFDRELNHIANQFFVSKNSRPVTIQSGSNNIDVDILTQMIYEDTVESTIQSDILNTIYRKSLQNYSGLDPNMLFANQMINAIPSYQLPSDTYIYTFDDIKKAYNSNYSTKQKDVEINACLTGYFLPKTFSHATVYLRIPNHNVLDNIKNDLLNSNGIDRSLIKDVIKIIDDSKKECLINLVVGKIDIGQPNILRLIAESLLMQQNTQIVPISYCGYLNPFSLCIIVDNNLANVKESNFLAEVNSIKHSFEKFYQFTTIPLKSIKTSKNIAHKIHTQYSRVPDANNKKSVVTRAKTSIKFQYSNENDRLKKLAKLINRRSIEIQSKNTHKVRKRTFMRPNRRHPDSISHQGTVSKTVYRPDIHIFIDTSGSMTEDKYQSAVCSIARLAQKLKCDIYISTFATHISQPICIKTKNLKVDTIAKKINSIPAVGGGTRYTNVWLQIDEIARRNKSERINVVITDFEYNLYSTDYFQPTNPSCTRTYYLSIRTNSDSERKYIGQYASLLCRKMISRGFSKARSHFIV